MLGRSSLRLAPRLRLGARPLCTEMSSTDALLIAAPPAMRCVDLNRPHTLNALNAEMVSTLLPLMRDWQQPGGDVKLVAFRGTGTRAFCAGGDIKALHDCSSAFAAGGGEGALEPAHAFFREEYVEIAVDL